jgi:acetyltransferase-like isoleucine patch superfamily enzyme
MIEHVIQFLKRRRNEQLLRKLGALKRGKNSRIDARVQFQVGVDPSTCSIVLGDGSLLRGTVSFERSGGQLSIGRNSSVNNSLIAIADKIEIGDDVLISYDCLIMDHNGHSLELEARRRDLGDVLDGKTKAWTGVSTGAVKLSNGVWIGTRAIILKRVIIGANTIVAAGAVVVKSVPSDAVVGGNPASVIRESLK